MLATSSSTIASSTIASATAVSASASANIASAPALPPGEEIYDLMGSVTMNYPWLELLGEIAIAIVALVLIWLFYSWLTAPVERIRKPIVQSPETQAFRAIKRLKLSSIWEKRDLKSICENVASILKSYTYDVYKLSIGAAATTDEFIPALIDGSVKNDILSEIKEMLNYCDEVRYTGNSINGIEQEELVKKLENLINTKNWLKGSINLNTKLINDLVMVKKLDQLFNSKEWKK